jgi:hypothetical protein
MPSTRKTITFLADLLVEGMLMRSSFFKHQLADISNCAILQPAVAGITGPYDE